MPKLTPNPAIILFLVAGLHTGILSSCALSPVVEVVAAGALAVVVPEVEVEVMMARTISLRRRSFGRDGAIV